MSRRLVFQCLCFGDGTAQGVFKGVTLILSSMETKPNSLWVLKLLTLDIAKATLKQFEPDVKITFQQKHRSSPDFFSKAFQFLRRSPNN